MAKKSKTGQAARLSQARINAGYKSPKEASKSFKWNYHTIINNENGARGLTAESALKYGNAYNVPANWLLYGRGPEADKLIDDADADYGELEFIQEKFSTLSRSQKDLVLSLIKQISEKK
ncbi:MAG: hypothetical protein ABJL18_00990 [Hyphomicrobiales bacterium]